MRIFPRKNGSDCGKAAILFWFSFRTNKISCPKIKTITNEDNLLFSYYHTKRLGGTYSHEQVTFGYICMKHGCTCVFSVSKRQTIRFRSWKCVLTLFCASSFRKKNVYTIMCSFSRYLGREYALFGQK